VSHFIHDDSGIFAEGVEDAREGAAQGVGGVSFCGSGGSRSLARFPLARSTDAKRTRERMFSREGRRPVRVANTNPSEP
jgi:hypothetical protein